MDDAKQIAEIIAIAQEKYQEDVLIEKGATIRQEQGGCWVSGHVWVENVYLETTGA